MQEIRFPHPEFSHPEFRHPTLQHPTFNHPDVSAWKTARGLLDASEVSA